MVCGARAPLASGIFKFVRRRASLAVDAKSEATYSRCGFRRGHCCDLGGESTGFGKEGFCAQDKSSANEEVEGQKGGLEMRTCIQQPRFAEGLDRLFPDQHERDEVLRSIENALAFDREPPLYQVFRQTATGSVLVYKSRGIQAFRRFIVLLSFDATDHVVFLHDIWGALPDED